MGATTVMAGAAVFGAGMSVYNTFAGSGAPDIGAPPAPANYYTYDEDGNLAGSQVWDPARNAYIYRPAPLTPEQRAEKEKRQGLKRTMLENLDKTPEDRIRAYQDYAKAISEGLHRDVDFQYEKMNTAKNEEMTARGLYGSRAYADTQAELARQKTLADVDIANKAELGKENLMNQDRQFWLSTLSALDNEANASAMVAANNMRNIQSGAQMATQDLLAGWDKSAAARLGEWQTQAALNNNFSNQMMNTASGLAFLYGLTRGNLGGSRGGGGNNLLNVSNGYTGLRLFR